MNFRLKSFNMKKMLLWVFALGVITIPATAQELPSKKQPRPMFGLGLKAGVNFANVTNADAINSKNQAGFLVGITYSPPAKTLIAYRTELTYSRQGYDYSTSGSTGSVKLNYLMIPQLMGINITRFAQVQLGFQMAFLLNARADSSKPAVPSTPYASLIKYYNRYDYGAAVGAELYPLRNLMVGARYNISFGKLYKDPQSVNNGYAPPSFIPNLDLKNNVVQLYAGLRF